MTKLVEGRVCNWTSWTTKIQDPASTKTPICHCLTLTTGFLHLAAGNIAAKIWVFHFTVSVISDKFPSIFPNPVEGFHFPNLGHAYPGTKPRLGWQDLVKQGSAWGYHINGEEWESRFPLCVRSLCLSGML